MDPEFARLAGISPNPYVLLDRDLRLVWMNDAYLAVTMRKREDILNKPMFEAFPSDPDSESFRQLRDSFDNVLETGEADEIALIRYDIASRDGSMETRYWSATHTPMLDDGGRLEYILQHTVDVTELHRLRQMREEMGLVRRANAIQARNRDLERASHRLLEFFEHAPGFVAVIGGEDHVFQMANAAYLELVGRTDILGKPVREALPEVVAQGFIEVLDEVYRTGEPFFGRRAPVILEGSNDPSHSRRILNFIFQPIRNEDDPVSGIIIQGYDVTEEAEYEEHQALLIKELNRRVKNSLAVVQGLAQQTYRGVPGAEGATGIFKGRLQALAAAHGLLTGSNWSPAEVRDVVLLTVRSAFGEPDARLDLEGPDFLLEPEVALALTMIVHELTTNAMKYGALSNDTGKVNVDWSVAPGEGCDVLTFRWRESGGPHVTEPDQPGFGTRLIQRGISSRRGSSVELRYDPDGVTCVLETSLERKPEEPAQPE